MQKPIRFIKLSTILTLLEFRWVLFDFCQHCDLTRKIIIHFAHGEKHTKENFTLEFSWNKNFLGDGSRRDWVSWVLVAASSQAA